MSFGTPEDPPRLALAGAAARDEGERWQGGGEQPVALISDDGAEPAVVVVPLLGKAGDLLTGPADEVPPHDQALLEGLAAEQQQLGRTVRPQPDRAAAGAEVGHRAVVEL